MSYQRDFTIGLRETQDFYLSLVLGRWRKGIAGFALVGALAALLYTLNAAFSLPVQAAAVLAGGVTALMPWLLAFAAGAMMYVVVEEMLPEAASRSGTLGALFGFLVMMVLDVALG